MKVVSYAFESSALETIYLPHSVKKIGEGAFHNTPLTDIYYNGTVDEWKAIEKGETIFSQAVTIHCTDGTYEQQP